MKTRLWPVAVILLALSLGVPSNDAPAAEFTLGGFIRLDTIWDSTQVNDNLTQFIARNNDTSFQHGRLKFSPQVTRMWWSIKGPKLWGADTTGYIEWDFDDAGGQSNGTGIGFSMNKPRLVIRHAMFRLNWPATELLMGQYWPLLTEEFPDVINAGAQSTGGNIYYRIPQIRLSQKFLGSWLASIALEEPMNGNNGTAIAPDQLNIANNPFTGESSESPRVAARLWYEEDLWGKGPYMGRPRGFAARLAASWQRSRYRAFTGAGRIFGADNFTAVAVTQRDQQYLNQWVVQGSLFVPLMTTKTQNLAGTLALLAQYYVGAGMDNTIDDTPQSASYLSRTGNSFAGDRTLLKRVGGFVELQYYFTNEWYINADWGFNRSFGLNRGSWMGTSASADPILNNQHYYLSLYYRPIQALKFGVEYAYVRTDYYQRVLTGSQASNLGEDHRLVFTGWFYF